MYGIAKTRVIISQNKKKLAPERDIQSEHPESICQNTLLSIPTVRMFTGVLFTPRSKI